MTQQMYPSMDRCDFPSFIVIAFGPKVGYSPISYQGTRKRAEHNAIMTGSWVYEVQRWNDDGSPKTPKDPITKSYRPSKVGTELEK